MMDDESETVAERKDTEDGAKKSAVSTGWGSPTAAGKSSGDATAPGKNDETTEDVDDEPKGRRRNLRDMEAEAETEMVMLIPDLDEEGEEEDITMQVAAAPRNMARRLQSIQQLDKDIKYTVPSTGDLDLSLLTACLVPPSMAAEDDAPWDFDTLLQQVTQEFTAEAELKAELAKENEAYGMASPGTTGALGAGSAPPGIPQIKMGGRRGNLHTLVGM